MPVQLETWATPDKQLYRDKGNQWTMARLFELSRRLPVKEIPLEHLYLGCTYDNMDLRALASYFKAVNAADLEAPIILGASGEIMDGRHRLVKALMEGRETIKAVRFADNPPPCSTQST